MPCGRALEGAGSVCLIPYKFLTRGDEGRRAEGQSGEELEGSTGRWGGIQTGICARSPASQ